MTTTETDTKAANSNVPAVTPEPETNPGPQSSLPGFVQEHPGITIAGGIAIGVIAAALLPRRSRKFVAEKSTAMADAVSAAGLMLYREAVDRAEAAGEGVRDMADRVSKTDLVKTVSQKTRRRRSRFELADGLSAIARHLRRR